MPSTRSTSQLADEELVRHAQTGRREAFEELVRRHAARLHAVVLRLSGDAGEAEEVVQEAFLRAWSAIGGFEQRAQFSTWLYRIGVNEANRRAARRPPAAAGEGDDAFAAIPDLRQAPEPQAERRALRRALERAVRDLPATYRTPLILRDIEGLSTAEAAAVMGLQEPAFKSRLHRARLAVRTALDDSGDGAP